MFENPRKYYFENVIPSYLDFIEHRKSNEWGQEQLLRKGIIAATSLFHFREHIPENIRPTKSQLKRQYPEYGLVGDITNASKHNVISHDSPLISSANQICEEMRLIFFADNDGKYLAPQLEIVVRLDNGTEFLLVKILFNVLVMWDQILDNLGIVKRAIRSPININEIISREQANCRRSNLVIMKGEDQKLKYQIQELNNITGEIIDLDITGMKFELVIGSLPESVLIHLTFEKQDVDKRIEIDFDVPLTNEQSMEYVELKGIKEKNDFIREIILTNSKIKSDLNKLVIAMIQTDLEKKENI